MTSNNGGSAFPIVVGVDDVGITGITGITVRDYFAAAALQGIVSNIELIGASLSPAALAWEAYRVADGMLAAREPQKEESNDTK